MGDLSTAFRYTDQEFDWETGLYNYRARMYDPVSAVFETPDPHLSPNQLFVENLTGSHHNPIGVDSAAGARSKSMKTKQVIAFFSATSQRLNRYAYVQNSPINYVDTNGLWPERIHNAIIRVAFPTLTENLKLQIEKGSAYADSWNFQSPEFNHMHAMSQKGESAETAINRMQEYVDSHLREYARLLGAGNPERAYFELGMALHPIMDSTSPSHEGFQAWEGVMNTPGYKMIEHFIKEQSISADRLNKTVEFIRQAME
jgi:RHS repeat-associated protein